MLTKRSGILISTAILLLTASGSGISAADESTQSPDGNSADVIGQGKFTAEGLPRGTGKADYTLEINKLERKKSSDLTTLTYTIHNKESSKSANVPFMLESETYNYSPTNSLSGVTIESNDTEKRYYTLSDDESNCLCPVAADPAVPNPLEPGKSITLWSSFWIPKDAKNVTVKVLGFSPVENLTIES